MRHLGICLLGLALAATRVAADDLEEVLAVERARIAAMDKARPAVVAIFSPGGSGGGSGVVISKEGYALSNFHVTHGAGDAMKCGLPDGSLLDAVIVGLDPTGDVALIKLFGKEEFAFAEMADSDDVQVGQWVFAMGNPFLLATDFQPTATYGIVSGVHRYQYPAGTFLEYTDCIQTDASINPGNSGGPLFNDQGQLIGINGRGSFEKRGRVNVGVGYAISINQIKHFLGQLQSGRVVDHATLGARVTTAADGRVVVSDILEESDAFRRGLRYGDEIVAFAGRPIGTVNALKNVIGIYPQGWQVPLVFRRNGERREVLVRLEPLHSEAELWEQVAGPRQVAPPDDAPDKPGEDKPKTPDPDEPAPHDAPQPKEKPAIPLPIKQRIQQGAKPDMPDVVKAHFEARQGYANYYFNRWHQERLLQAVAAAHGSFADAAGPWLLKGELEGSGEAEFDLRDDRVTTLLPGGKLQLEISDNLTGATDPPDTGGLLTALYFWRQFLRGAATHFSQVYYLGTAPLAGYEGLVDVLVAVDSGVECHFYIGPQGRLVALELFTDRAVDPCHLRLLNDIEVEGRQVANRFSVYHGTELYGTFRFAKIELRPPTDGMEN